MKKNIVTKVLFMFVIFAMVFALVACGNTGSKDSGTTGGGTSATALKTPTVTITDGVASWGKVTGAGSYSYTITDENDEEVDTGSIKSSATLQVTLEEGQSIVVKAVPKDTTKYSESEYSVKATYTKTVTAVDKLIGILDGVNNLVDTVNGIENNSMLGAEAILKAFFTTNQKTSSVALDVKAGLNGKSVANSNFLIDFQLNDESYVSLGFANGKILVREPLNFVNTDDEKADAFYIDVTALQDSVNALVKLALTKLADIPEIEISGLIDDLKPTLKSVDKIAKLDKLLSFEELENGGTSIGLKCSALNTLLGLVPTFLEGVDIDEYGGYLDKVVSFVQENVDEDMFVLKDGKTLSWNYIKTQIANKNNADNALLKIDVATSDNAIKSIGINFDLSALDKTNLDYAFGIEIALPTFGLNQGVQVDASDFKSKDLKLSTDVNLGVKGIEAKLDANICLSEAFAKAGNIYGYATLTATTNDGGSKVAKGYIDGKGAYVDFSEIFELFEVTGKQTKYQQLYELNGKTLDAFINDTVTGLVDGILNPAKNAFTVDGAIEAVQGGEASIYAYIYNEILPMLDGDLQVKADAGLVDILTWVENIEFAGHAVKDYLKIELAQESWADLAAEFVNAHEAGKAALAAAINIDEDADTVGIQFSGDDSLLVYLDSFVQIPSTEGSFANISDTTALNAWLDVVFPAGTTRTLVESLLGTGLSNVVNSVYFEAQGYDGYGYHGRVAAKESATGAIYVSIEASISLSDGTDSLVMATKTCDTNGAVNFNSKDAEGYTILNACKALLNAVVDYGQPG